MAGTESALVRCGTCTGAERDAVERALYVLCGNAAPVRIHDTLYASMQGAYEDGSVNMIHMNVAFIVETEPYTANAWNNVDIWVMYNATYCVLDRDRSSVRVEQKHLRVIETLSERYPRLLTTGSIELYMAYMTFVVSVLRTLGIPECITDRLTITAINGITQ